MIARALPLLLLAVPLCVVSAAPRRAPVPAQVASVLAADAEARWIPFEVTAGNQIRFGAIANGRPVQAILDTGVSRTIITPEFAAGAGIAATGAEVGAAIGGDVKVGRATLGSLAFGGLTLTRPDVIVTGLPVAAAGGRPVSLLVGADVLRRYALDVDFSARRFRLLPSGRMPFAGTVAPLAIDPTYGAYVTELTLNGRRLRPILVDTGDGSGVTLSAASWKTAAVSGARLTDTIAFGLGGLTTFDLTVLPQVSIGAVTARDVEVQVEPADGYSTRIGLAGRIGAGFLGRYRVLLDPAARQMVLSAPADAAAAPVRSTSGLLLEVTANRLNVLHVMRGSPAAATGWKRGDAICAVNGTPVTPTYAQGSLGRWTVGAPGTTVSLQMCGGATRSLTLASFY
ncbi:aspartyl protease family protein [Sphingomonas aracearum]|uniref:PDZ domain-containing protein n=1 Tax=Sphingomonas aracearum TaxID=2283317 RepID=A0A369VYK3_9SPHN|nr:aspartyl protease family protein [Sphingomonas aracearum]RDE06707.1 PDZ domain-containing protein [Sphingomonas aracearum]